MNFRAIASCRSCIRAKSSGCNRQRTSTRRRITPGVAARRVEENPIELFFSLVAARSGPIDCSRPWRLSPRDDRGFAAECSDVAVPVARENCAAIFHLLREKRSLSARCRACIEHMFVRLRIKHFAGDGCARILHIDKPAASASEGR